MDFARMGIGLCCAIAVTEGALCVAQPIADAPVAQSGEFWEFRFAPETEGATGTWLRRIDRVLPNGRLEINRGDDASKILAWRSSVPQG